jgi:AcrR family transcriptional regulator
METAFIDQGYEAITMIEIADACGFTRRALYHHYRSKVVVAEHYNYDAARRYCHYADAAQDGSVR